MRFVGSSRCALAAFRGLQNVRRSGARALDPLDHFADRQHDRRRPDAPPCSGEHADDHSDSDDRHERDELGSTEMEASGLRHRFIMPSTDATDAPYLIHAEIPGRHGQAVTPVWATLYGSSVAILEVVRSIEIERDAEVVRRQFGDVAHHAAASLHRGVVFEVIEDDGACCHYRQISTVGPLKLRQEITLDRTGSGPLVNRIVAGQFAGGAISFDVQSLGDDRSVVEARLTAALPLAIRLAAPIFRAQVGKQLAAALVEDKADLEGGAYGQP
jgi:hypothetical protein